jgi:hypothetical protein
VRTLHTSLSPSQSLCCMYNTSSSVIHYITLGSPPRLTRLTQFVTFMPKKFRTEKVLSGRIKSLIDGVANNHWAGLALRVPLIPFPAWSEKAKSIRSKVRPLLEDEGNEGDRAVLDEEGVISGLVTPAEGGSGGIVGTDTRVGEEGGEGEGEQSKKRKATSEILHELRDGEGGEGHSPLKKKRSKKLSPPVDQFPRYIQDLL